MGSPTPGMVLDGRYRLVEKIAVGGMGMVYRAERLKLGRRVAVKFLHPQMASDPEFSRRFEQEARALSRLSHPHCVSVIDFGIVPGPYLVMEYVSGNTLDDLLHDGPLAPARALDITRQILAALAHAHAQDIVHRDIKPANVIVTEATGTGDHVRILDFGLAKLCDGSSSKSTSKVVLGTPSYMSPEQAQGKAVDARADLYATGVLLFELLTGVKPFSAEETVELLRLHCEARPPALAEAAPGRVFPAELEEVVARALAKDPEERIAGALEFAQALDDVELDPDHALGPGAGASSPTGLLRPSSTTEVRRRSRQGALLAVAAYAFAAALFALGGLGDGVAGVSRHEPASPGVTAEGPLAAAGLVPAVDAEALDALDGDAGDDGGDGADEGEPWPGEDGLDQEGADGEDDQDELTFELEELELEDGLYEDLDEAGAAGDDGVDTAGDDRGAGDAGEATPATARQAAVPQKPAVPATQGPPTLRTAERLAAAGKREAAIGTLLELRRRHPQSWYVHYLLGNLYFDKKWWTDGLKSYATALTRDRRAGRLKQFQENAIAALADPRTRARAARLLRAVGRPALPRLRRAAQRHPSPAVRRAAGALATGIARGR